MTPVQHELKTRCGDLEYKLLLMTVSNLTLNELLILRLKELEAEIARLKGVK